MRTKVLSLSLAYLALVLLGSGRMVSYLAPSQGGPAGGLQEGDGIYEVTFYPPEPQPGGNITFNVRYRGFDQSQPRIRIMWIQLNGSHYESAERSPGGSWQIPNETGVLAYMAYVEEGGPANYTVAFSSIGLLAVPRNVSIVENSPLIRVWAEEPARWEDGPFPRIVVQVAKNNTSPAVRILCISYELFTGSVEGGGAFGPLFEDFANRSENDDWVTYVVEPEDLFSEFYHPAESPVAPIAHYWPAGRGLICVCVAGYDSEGTIHFAEPLFYSTDIPEHLPTLGCNEQYNHTGVAILEVGHSPASPRPGDNITILARCNMSATVRVNYQHLTIGDPLSPWPGGTGNRTIDCPIPALVNPSILVYQLEASTGDTLAVSDFTRLLVPEMPHVIDSRLLLVEAEEVGHWSSPPFAKIVADVRDDLISDVYFAYTYYSQCGFSGSGGPVRMEKEGTVFVCRGEDARPGDASALRGNTVVYLWACGVDKEGVVHFSETCRYIVGDAFPHTQGP